MNDIVRHQAAIADLFDIYPVTIDTRIGKLRLVSAAGDHASDSPFAQLEVVQGLPCDGLVYIDETDRRGRHLVAVFHGADDYGSTAIAVCRDWKWQWFGGNGKDVARIVTMCLQGVQGEASPPAGTIVGDLALRGGATGF